METKELALQQTKVKMGAEGNLKFSGYASVFNGIDSYGDMIMPGAYKNTIVDRERPIQLRWNHYGPVIGKFTEVYEDEKGLFVEGELTKGHSTAEDAAALLRHGAISGLSIGYVAKDEEQDGVIRKLKEIDLFEISLVESPADNNAHISSIKSAEKLKDIESVLRQKGFSQKEATEIVAKVKKIVHGEREQEKAAAEKAAIEAINLFKESLK
jgi:HK97 family phage prohead protease